MTQPAAPIPMFSTFVSPSAGQLVAQQLATGFLSEGEIVKRFEGELARTFGWHPTVALNSGTAALHLALVIAGVRAGDEVLLPAQTFIASGLAVLMAGAVPVFVDIDRATGNLDPAALAQSVGPRARAVMPVHWAGYPCDMDEIAAVARRHGLAVVEDAAHALGATYRGRPVGSISDFTCFSFQAIKHLTTGDGGAIAIRPADAHQRAMKLRWFAIDRAGSPMGELGEREYDVTETGYKYHMNDYAAVLGLANLDGVDSRLRRHRLIRDSYRSAFRGVAGIELFRDDGDRESSSWIFGMHVENRSAFVRAMKARGVPASVVHTRIDRNSVFANSRRELPQQELFDATQIHLPCHMHISDHQLDHIITAVKHGW